MDVIDWLIYLIVFVCLPCIGVYWYISARYDAKRYGVVMYSDPRKQPQNIVRSEEEERKRREYIEHTVRPIVIEILLAVFTVPIYCILLLYHSFSTDLSIDDFTLFFYKTPGRLQTLEYRRKKALQVAEKVQIDSATEWYEKETKRLLELQASKAKMLEAKAKYELAKEGKLLPSSQTSVLSISRLSDTDIRDLALKAALKLSDLGWSDTAKKEVFDDLTTRYGKNVVDEIKPLVEQYKRDLGR